MWFDIIVGAFFFYFSYRGYEKGLVSSLLSIVLFIFSIFFSRYIWKFFPILKLGPFSNIIQIFITTILVLIIGKIVIKIIDFENIFIIGTLSKILGLLIYSVIFIILLSFICEVIYFLKSMRFIENNFLSDSIVLTYYKKILPLNIFRKIFIFFIKK